MRICTVTGNKEKGVKIMPRPYLGDPKYTIEVLQKYNFAFQKRFGQNFLIDTHVLDKIIDSAQITKDDFVLEIGPGIGTMTQYLAEAAREVAAVEIDKTLLPILDDTLKDWDNVTVINNDILKVDIRQLALEKNQGRPIKVVANLPYYITTPIIMGLFENQVPVDSITIMVQKEVADRMQVGPGTKDYGALSLAVQYYAKPKIVANVPPNCFMPRPKVGSAVIRLERYEKPPVEVKNEKLMFRIIRASFNQRRKTLQAFVESQADSQLVKGFQYFKVCDDYQLEYILVAHGDDEDTYMVGKLAAFQIQNLIVAYKERFDKDSFIKNLLLDNLLLVDIYNRAKKLHIEADVRRVVMILEMPQEKDHSSMESVKSLFGGKSKDFITAVDEKSIIVVKELEDGENYPEMDQLAHTILDTLGMGNDGKTHMAYGTIVNELKEVSRSYKEARMALDVGKIFFGDKEVIAYSSLGIGRLIYQLPIPLCKMFIKEIFGGKSPDDFDEETLVTIDKFFENSLNVSETSRQLYIHRNTLVYRLDKLQKSTGLDLRVFEDAITFKIALMVVRYMKYMETLEY